ncbi:hypothetical protein B0H19DRAFT_1196476 [Mycena capillaripes]|nr:hypothetical protein B0H19DRAFT_1196476 [Mycena capillaripes]
MSSSAVPHVVAFLTRPLLPAFAPAAVSSAQLILTASLGTVPSATYTLNATSTPAPLRAASIGAAIPWAAWVAALGSDEILLFYGPGYVKVRLGDAPVTTVWTAETQSGLPFARVQAQPKIGPSPLLQQSTGVRLRAMLLSARVRSMRRQQAAVEPIHIQSHFLAATSDSDSDSDSESDYSDSDSTSGSSTSSKFTSYSNDSLTSAGSPPATPSKSASSTLPSVGVYRPPFLRLKPAPRATATAPVSMSAKKTTTAYHYQGGVTRVMTGGVLLGPRPTAHVVRATRS